jgi:short-subunit dehydrogenase
MNLKNKNVVITGGTKGLGRALALAFILEGASVIVCSKDKKEAKSLPSEILYSKADVTKEKNLEKFLEVAKKKLGNIDIWINNAGIWLPHKPIEKTDWKRARDLMEVNLFGTVYGSKLALIEMRKRNSGTIINILSTSALIAKPNDSAYCASKFAAKGFTDSLKKEVEKTKIKIYSIYPARMQTNLFDEDKPDDYDLYMSPGYVADKIIENLKSENGEGDLIIKRPEN